MDRILAWAAFVVLLVTAGSAARAASYTAVDLYTLQAPAGLTEPAASGAFAGQVVGYAAEPSDPEATPRLHAVLWNPNGSAVDLTMTGSDATGVVGTDGVHQFGWVRTGAIGYNPTITPVVWSGSAASATFLNKQGFTSASVAASGGGQFVGGALLWNGLDAQPISLSPANLYGTNGTQQVGSRYAFDANNNAYYHAMLYTGSASSAVDLHPPNRPGIVSSEALATDGRQQVGWGGPYLVYGHALVWSGTANSAVDLNPAGFAASVAYGVQNGTQVGLAHSPDYHDHAMLWNGTAASAVDLHLLLPNSFQSSRAYSIDEAGHVFGVGFNGSDRQWHAIEWLSVAAVSGDYNGDGKVDATDYVLWRKTGGTQAGYNDWRTNFGATVTGAAAVAPSASASDVPEPSSLGLLLPLAAAARRRSRARRRGERDHLLGVAIPGAE
jgi:hypothetical protein